MGIAGDKKNTDCQKSGGLPLGSQKTRVVHGLDNLRVILANSHDCHGHGPYLVPYPALDLSLFVRGPGPGRDHVHGHGPNVSCLGSKPVNEADQDLSVHEVRTVVARCFGDPEAGEVSLH